MNLDGREIHGGTVKAGIAEDPLILFEQDDSIIVKKGYYNFGLSSGSARVLASKLNRLALRIEKRREATKVEEPKA